MIINHTPVPAPVLNQFEESDRCVDTCYFKCPKIVFQYQSHVYTLNRKFPAMTCARHRQRIPLSRSRTPFLSELLYKILDLLRL